MIRLGCCPAASGGQIHGIQLDTAFFTGNFPPMASVQATNRCEKDEDEDKRDPSMGKCASQQDMEMIAKYKSDEWETIVPMTKLNPGYESTRYHYFGVASRKTFTHLRLNLFPDGGVARLKTYGVVVPNVDRLLTYNEDGIDLIDLAAMENGGVCLELSDAHYGHPRNIIRKGRGVNMGDGWETARRLDRPPILKVKPETGMLDFCGGEEWCILKLGVPGTVKKFEVDTNHFKGNSPDSISIEGRLVNSDVWFELLGPQKLRPHERHFFGESVICSHKKKVDHVKVTIRPDGGISRVRILGLI